MTFNKILCLGHVISRNTEDLHNLQWSAGAACLSLCSPNFSPAVSEELGQTVLQLTSDLEYCHTEIIRLNKKHSKV